MSTHNTASRSVRFAVEQATYIEPTSQFVNQDLYYSRDDYQRIDNENKACSDLMSQCKPLENDCERGLEFKILRFGRRRCMNRQRSRMAVIEEQSRQREMGLSEPSLLAEIYRGFCSHCYRQAINLAAKDASAAREIIGSDMNYLTEKDGSSCDITEATESSDLSSSEFLGDEI